MSQRLTMPSCRPSRFPRSIAAAAASMVDGSLESGAVDDAVVKLDTQCWRPMMPRCLSMVRAADGDTSNLVAPGLVRSSGRPAYMWCMSCVRKLSPRKISVGRRLTTLCFVASLMMFSGSRCAGRTRPELQASDHSQYVESEPLAMRAFRNDLRVVPVLKNTMGVWVRCNQEAKRRPGALGPRRRRRCVGW